MTTSFRYEPGGATQVLLDSQLNSLAASTGSAVGSTVWDNSAQGNQYFWGDFELLVTYGTAPTAGQTCDLYMIESVDGTNYADGSATIQVASHYIGSFVLRAVNTAQRITIRGVPLPPCKFKLELLNGAGQAMAASGNQVQALLYRTQGI